MDQIDGLIQTNIKKNRFFTFTNCIPCKAKTAFTVPDIKKPESFLSEIRTLLAYLTTEANSLKNRALFPAVRLTTTESTQSETFMFPLEPSFFNPFRLLTYTMPNLLSTVLSGASTTASSRLPFTVPRGVTTVSSFAALDGATAQSSPSLLDRFVFTSPESGHSRRPERKTRAESAPFMPNTLVVRRIPAAGISVR